LVAKVTPFALLRRSTTEERVDGTRQLGAVDASNQRIDHGRLGYDTAKVRLSTDADQVTSAEA
jgi:hypothetical protein